MCIIFGALEAVPCGCDIQHRVIGMQWNTYSRAPVVLRLSGGLFVPPYPQRLCRDDTVTFTATLDVIGTAQARYDIGL